jgi:hypothetical protein
VFAAILQAPETSSELSCRLCTAEGVGSNPIGSTLKIRALAGEIRSKGEGSEY